MTDTPTGTPHRNEDDLPGLAAVYALDAVDERERGAILDARRGAAPEVRREFDRRVRAHREALAAHAQTTAVPAPESLRGRLWEAIAAGDDGAHTGDAPEDLPTERPAADATQRRRRRVAQGLAAAAAAAVLVAGGVAIGHQFTVAPEPPAASQVFTAPDVRTAAIQVAGGTATVVYSREANAAVLVMNDVAPPQPGRVYQLWLMGSSHAPTAVGTMDSADVAPSTQALIQGIDASTSLGISLEPAGGSARPTTIVADIAMT